MRTCLCVFVYGVLIVCKFMCKNLYTCVFVRHYGGKTNIFQRFKVRLVHSNATHSSRHTLMNAAIILSGAIRVHVCINQRAKTQQPFFFPCSIIIYVYFTYTRKDCVDMIHRYTRRYTRTRTSTQTTAIRITFYSQTEEIESV